METVPKRSWIDTLVDRVVGLPVPWYVLAIVAWLVFSTLLALPLWLDGSEPYGSYPAITRVDPVYVIGGLFGYAYLARYARRAFDRFRPALAATDAEASDSRHRISTLSPRVGWVAFIVGATGGVVSTLTDDLYTAFLTSPTAKIAWSAFGVGVFFVVAIGVLIVNQLRLIARLHRAATHIDLFRPAPLHAFAGLSARAGSIVLLTLTFSMFSDPEPVVSPGNVAGVALGAAAFLLPLIGLSRRLRVEKRLLLDESAGLMSAVRQKLHTAARLESFDSGGDLRAMLAALSEDHDRIRKLSPWPWDAATVRGFVTTLLIPISTWLVTTLLNRALF